MEKDQLTFNDLPTVVGELCDRIASMEILLAEKLSKQYETKENTHVPMTVQEACNYLKCRCRPLLQGLERTIFRL